MSRYEYDILVIGGGAAGLTASSLAATLGARTALIEQNLLGGDCTWTGCVPSKSLVKAAKVVHEMRTADRYGLPVFNEPIDFAQVMRRLRSTRERIYLYGDSPEVLSGRNVEFIHGSASFLDPHTLHVESESGTRVLTSRYMVICAGACPILPPLPGFDEEDILTNETLFEEDELPRRLLVLGAGPIGVEMGQALRRLGSEVTIVEREEEILPNDEAECAAIVREALEAEGISVLLKSTLDQVERAEDGDGYRVQVVSGEEWRSFRCDKVLVAVGRRSNVSGLCLEGIGVNYNSDGIIINHSCQTSVDHIYACGDVVNGLNFTHVAENMARTAITRILMKVPASWEREAVPRVTFSDPEMAHLGKTARELEAEGERFRTIRFPYEKLDRAVIDAEERGMIVIHSSSVAGRILGAHVVGTNAGELINELTLAMKNGLSLRNISQTVHAYPTWSIGIRRASDQWYVQQGSPGMLKVLRSIFHLRGEISDDIGTENII